MQAKAAQREALLKEALREAKEAHAAQLAAATEREQKLEGNVLLFLVSDAVRLACLFAVRSQW